MTAVPRADSSAMLRNMRFTCQFLSPGSFAEYQSDWPLGLLDISQFNTRSNINDQNKISLCTTRILPHFSSDYEQSLDRFPRLYRPWFLPNSSCVCPASFFPCRVTYRLMISSVIPTVDTKYPLTTSVTEPYYGHSLDIHHRRRIF